MNNQATTDSSSSSLVRADAKLQWFVQCGAEKPGFITVQGFPTEAEAREKADEWLRQSRVRVQVWQRPSLVGADALTEAERQLNTLELRHYFGEGRCAGHSQFNGRYCRDAAGPDRWCINCAGYMLVKALASERAITRRLREGLDTVREVSRAADLAHAALNADVLAHDKAAYDIHSAEFRAANQKFEISAVGLVRALLRDTEGKQ